MGSKEVCTYFYASAPKVPEALARILERLLSSNLNNQLII